LLDPWADDVIGAGVRQLDEARRGMLDPPEGRRAPLGVGRRQDEVAVRRDDH
jgi:hypothetical protein